MIQTIKNLHKTFYDSRFYSELVFSWKGIGLGFLLIISLVNTGHLMAIAAKPYRLLMQEREAIFASLPSMEIKEGRLSSENDQPITISMLEGLDEGPIRIVIDTKNEMTDEAATVKRMAAEKLVVLVNADAISIFSPVDNKIEVRKVKDMADNKITHEQWQKISEALAAGFLPMTLFFIFCVTLMGHLLTAALGGILLVIISPLFKIKLPFQAAMRLSCAAKVPVALVFLVVLPQTVLQTLLWFGFVIFGLFSAKMTRDYAT
ncbi:MAG: DUF1189 family protein [Alphaproteobacteria bacterium]|nr:DUF1189 family protein [Alphaproteobacteria bacterium]